MMGKKKEKVNETQSKSVQKSAKVVSDKKTYSSPATHTQVSSTSVCSDAFSMRISSDIEAAMLELIRNDMASGKASGKVSQRLSARKLTDMYMCLRAANFPPTYVEQAMTATVHRGGDLIDALDWLCLNLPNDQLPDGFSQVLQQEEMKHRQPSDRLPLESMATDADERIKGQEVARKAHSADDSDKTTEKTPSTSKQWILQFAEQDVEEEDDDILVLGDGREAMSAPDIDPNEQYIELTAKLLDARCEAASATVTEARKHELTKNISRMVHEMKALEKSPGFDARVKLKDVIDVDLSEKKPAAAAAVGAAATAGDMMDEGDDVTLDDGPFNIFSEESTSSNTAASTQKTPDVSSASSKSAPTERRSFAYTRQQWTGKSPKQFLTDWTRKNLPKTSTLSFDRKEVRGGWWLSRCKVTRKSKEGDLDVCPTILCDNVKDAEHLASTLALYHLCRGQRVYSLLPPPYRDVWLEWLTAEETEKKKAAGEDVRPRDEFVGRLLSSLKLEPSSAVAMVTSDSKDEIAESWEDHVVNNENSENEDVSNDNDGDDDKISHKSSTAPVSAKRTGTFPPHQLKQIFERNRRSAAYERLAVERQRLPVFQDRENILSAFRCQNVLIVAGETGSGKSTQVPQFVLEELIESSVGRGAGELRHIVCTEPRRISAVSLAERVSAELGEPSGPGRRDSLCGYQIRFENRRCATTRLTYCTTGVLLRRLHDDPHLNDVACIIVDEVHERSVESDFLLIHLRRLIEQRADLRVVLMSATLDARKFSSYFSGCPVVSVPGRSFPVQIYHLEDVIEKTGYKVDEDSRSALRMERLIQIDSARVSVTGQRGTSATQSVSWTKDDILRIDLSDLDPSRYSLSVRNAVTRLDPNYVNLDLIVDLLHVISDSAEFSSLEGAVLVFLPGLSHIQNLFDLLSADKDFCNDRRYVILPLHSSLSSAEQSRVFVLPPAGVRKIVLSTNIAETGVTIPDVVFVIDSGRVKENRYAEATQMSQLVEVAISKASAQQRSGRAGRVRPGFCFRLFTEPTLHQLAGYSVPEILRIPLEELCLHIMKCGLGSPTDFLRGALDPPSVPSITRAMSILNEVGACQCDDTTNAPTLTALGCHLALLPINVRLAKMLIYAAVFGVLEPAAIMAASMMDKSPFVAAVDKRNQSDAAKTLLAIENSDHLTLYNAFVCWKAAKKVGSAAERSYCDKYFLKRSSLVEIENVSRELVKMVKSCGFSASLLDMLSAWKSQTLSKAFADQTDTNIGSVSDLTAGSPSAGLSAVLKAVLAAGLYPRVGRTEYIAPVDVATNPVRRACTVETVQGEAQLHPSSVNRFLATNGWLVYHEKVRSSQSVYLRDVSVVSSTALLLFGGAIDIQHQQQLVTLDRWMTFKAPAKTGVIFKEIRQLVDQLLQRKLENPSLDLTGEPLVRVLVELIVSDVMQKR